MAKVVETTGERRFTLNVNEHELRMIQRALLDDHTEVKDEEDGDCIDENYALYNDVNVFIQQLDNAE